MADGARRESWPNCVSSDWTSADVRGRACAGSIGGEPGAVPSPAPGPVGTEYRRRRFDVMTRTLPAVVECAHSTFSEPNYPPVMSPLPEMDLSTASGEPV